MNRQLLLLLGFGCILAHTLFAQQTTPSYIMTKQLLSVEDGLASREVFCGLQDRYGFVWFGSRNGLNRYDGKNMLLFNRQRNQLQQNKVIHLAHDEDTLLFIQYGESGYHRRSIGMVDVMNIASLTVRPLSKTFPKLPFQEKNIVWVQSAAAGKIHILTTKPFQLWEYSASYPTAFKLLYNLKEGKDPVDITPAVGPYCFFPNTESTILYELPDGYLMVAPDKTIPFKTSNGEQMLPFAVTPDHEYIVSYNSWANQVSHFALVNKKGQLDFNVNLKAYGLQELNGRIFECTPIMNGSDIIVKFFEDGIYLRRNGNLHKIIAEPSYKDLAVYEAFIDQNKKLWLCTSMGVFLVKISNNSFQHYLTKQQQNNQPKNQIRGIYVDSSGKLYANMWESLFVLHGTSTKYASLGDNTEYMHLVYALHQHKGKIYIGGYYPLLYNEGRNRIEELPNNHALMDIWSMYSLSDSVLLLGRNNDIELYNINTHKSTLAVYAHSSFPKARFVYRFLKSTRGEVWAASENGLFKLNAAGAIVDYYGDKTDAAHMLPYSNISDVYEDRNGVFWIATNGDGLYKWDRPNNHFTSFKITDGLPSDILYRIESDAKDHLWISSDYGLIQFNTHNNLIQTYTVKDGISSNEYNRISSFKGADERLYFGGLNGIDAFYPSDFWGDTARFDAPLQLISLSKFTSQTGLVTEFSNKLNATKTIEILPEDKFLRLEFMLLDFEKEHHKYAYQIVGLDKDWNYINENVIQLSGIPYGYYTLRIKGQNQSGQWSAQELTFPLVVISPFYKQLWFMLLAGLGFILLVFLIIRYRTYKLTRDNEYLEQTVNQRTDELKELLTQKDMMVKEIHHRVKNNLQVISSLLEIQGFRTIDENTKAALTETQNRVLSIAFIHQNLYQHDGLKGVEMSTFVTELTKHVSAVFSKLGHDIVVEQKIDNVFIDIDTAVPLGLIINELMTNSYKYAFTGKTSGKIKIEIAATDPGHFQLSYSDNGVGLPEGIDFTQSKTLGLRLIKQLSKQLHGIMHYKHESGSMFELQFKDLSIRTKGM